MQSFASQLMITEVLASFQSYISPKGLVQSFASR